MAFGTLAGGEKLVCPFLSTGTVVVVHDRAEILDHTVEGDEIITRRVYQFGTDADILEGTVKYLVEGIFGQITDGCLQIALILLKYGTDLPEYHLVLIFSEWNDGSVVNTDLIVGYNLVEIYLIQISQTLALGTGALGRVEREIVRCRVTVRHTRGRAHQSTAVVFHLPAVLVEDHDQSVTLTQGDIHTLLQSFVVLLLYGQLVDDHFDIMILVSVYLHAAGNLHDLSVDTDIEVPLAAHTLEEFAVMALTTSYQRSQDENLMPVIVVHDHVKQFLFGILDHLFAGSITVGGTGAGVEQTQVIVHLGGCADRRTGVLVCCLLFDADHWTQSCNLVYIRAFHAAEEIPGVSRERLYIASLTFGEYRVESQRRLARTTQSGYDRQTVSWNLHIHILEVMDTGTPYIYLFVFAIHLFTFTLYVFIILM